MFSRLELNVLLSKNRPLVTSWPSIKLAHASKEFHNQFHFCFKFVLKTVDDSVMNPKRTMHEWRRTYFVNDQQVVKGAKNVVACNYFRIFCHTFRVHQVIFMTRSMEQPRCKNVFTTSPLFFFSFFMISRILTVRSLNEFADSKINNVKIKNFLKNFKCFCS